MRKGLFKFISFFLTAATLFASTGVVIASHICSSAQKQEVSLFENDGCCGKKGKHCEPVPVSSGIKKNCCQLSVTYHKIEINSIQHSVSVDQNAMAQSVSFVFQNTLSEIIAEVQYPDCKIRGKDFLLFIHLLLI